MDKLEELILNLYNFPDDIRGVCERLEIPVEFEFWLELAGWETIWVHPQVKAINERALGLVDQATALMNHEFYDLEQNSNNPSELCLIVGKMGNTGHYVMTIPEVKRPKITQTEMFKEE